MRSYCSSRDIIHHHLMIVMIMIYILVSTEEAEILVEQKQKEEKEEKEEKKKKKRAPPGLGQSESRPALVTRLFLPWLSGRLSAYSYFHWLLQPPVILPYIVTH